MKVKIEEDGEGALKFALTGASNSYANALRRAAMSLVGCFAIDKVTFYENGSVMFDEYIAHRIGLAPISTPAKVSGDEEVLFTLEANGPCTVYSELLKSQDKEVRTANGKIPLVKLTEGQQLRLDAKAIVGTGITHAKFQPAIATFEQTGDDSFDFYIESFGQMTPREVAQKAIDALNERVKEIKKDIKK